MNVNDNHSQVIITNRKIVFLKLEQDIQLGIKTCGFHLTRSKWDPYPWIGHVEDGSVADAAGLRAGDCLLEIDGLDVVGLKVKQIATVIRRKESGVVNLGLWRSSEEDEEVESTGVLSGPLPLLAKKLVKVVSGAVCALECPVCLETAVSPVSQCVHGHILCVNCRMKTPRCPICRVKLGQGRCLLADKIHKNIREAFENESVSSVKENTSSLKEKLFGKRTKQSESSAKSSQSFAKLLIGGFSKAISADNLSTSIEHINSKFNQQKTLAASPRLGELSQTDRPKSASTGELNKNNDKQSNQCEISNSSGFLNVPTPTWGGSTDSIVSNTLFVCPLAHKTFCRDSIGVTGVMEHLGTCHSTPQIHIYGSKASFPLSFIDETFLLIIHYQEELFFFQHKNEISWMSSAIGKGEWILSGFINDNQIKFKRLISQLNNHKPNLPCYLAPLPNSTVLNLEINLSQSEIQL